MIRITLPFPPAALSGHANGNGRWAKIALTKKWREDARKAAILFAGHEFPEGDIPLDVLFIPPDKRGDRWNFPQRAKCQIDGIAEALGVNDKRFLPVIRHAPPQKPGYVIVTVGEQE